MDKKTYHEMVESKNVNKWFGSILFFIVLVLGIGVSFATEYFLDQNDSKIYIVFVLFAVFLIIIVLMVILSIKVPFIKRFFASIENKASFGTIYRTKIIEYDKVIGTDYLQKLEQRFEENGYQEIAREGKLTLYKQSNLVRKHIMLIRVSNLNLDSLLQLDRRIIDEYKQLIPLQVIIYAEESTEELRDYLTYEIDTFQTKRAYILIDHLNRVICYKNTSSIEKSAHYVGKYDYKTIFGYSKKEL